MAAEVAAVVLIAISAVPAQQTSVISRQRGIVGGVVLSDQRPVADATVQLVADGTEAIRETRTDASGRFLFSNVQAKSYRLIAEKEDRRSRAVHIATTGGMQRFELALENEVAPHKTGKGRGSSAFPPVQFADAPSFSVAGMTDWTAVGGHGSDSILRTSEALARDTRMLTAQGKTAAEPGEHRTEAALRAALAADPENAGANHILGEFLLNHGKYSEALPLLEKAYRLESENYQNSYDLARAYEAADDSKSALNLVSRYSARDTSGNMHRLAGEIDETMGNPVAAVHEYEQAAHMNPSKENYFEWGSELLYHRAVWQALQVFRQGTKTYPKSSRMLTALASAQFAGALYNKAAMNFCKASDLNPGNREIYLFMGKVELASPAPLPCVRTRLERFAHAHPESSTADYLYAMAILKGRAASESGPEVQEAKALLEKAVGLNHSCGEAYLQLGIMAYSRHDVDKAITYYKDAIAAKPELADSYYRLGVAYDHLGEKVQAKQEFQLHDEIGKMQAKAVDAQRREIKQFIIVQNNGASAPTQQ